MKLSKKNKKRIRRILERSDLQIKLEAERYRANIAEASLARVLSEQEKHIIIPGPYTGLQSLNDCLVTAFMQEAQVSNKEVQMVTDLIAKTRMSK